mgnify:CR=1 FL=1
MLKEAEIQEILKLAVWTTPPWEDERGRVVVKPGTVFNPDYVKDMTPEQKEVFFKRLQEAIESRFADKDVPPTKMKQYYDEIVAYLMGRQPRPELPVQPPPDPTETDTVPIERPRGSGLRRNWYEKAKDSIAT